MKIVIWTFAAIILSANLKAQDSSALSNQVSFDTTALNKAKTGNFKDKFFVGLEIGCSRNYLLTNFSNLAFTEIKPLNGYVIGFPMEYRLNSWMSISSNPNLAKKNYQIARSGFFQGVYENFTNSYIQLPLFGHFTFGEKKINGFLNMGVYGAYWIASRIKGTEPNILNPVDTAYHNSNPTSIFDIVKPYSYDEKYEFSRTRDRRLELGWLLGVGINYHLNSNCKFFVEGRLTRAMTDQQKNYMTNQTPRYNKTYGFSIGCLVNLAILKRQK